MGRSTEMRSSYQKRFILRLIMFFLMTAVYLWDRSKFDILNGWAFFQSFSVLHMVWLLWMWDMFRQLMPSDKISMGSKKQFKKFAATAVLQEKDSMRRFQKEKNKEAVRVLVPWLLLTAAIGFFCTAGILQKPELFLICGLFYIGDIVCVLFWCPFSDLLMGNRCCATCRIYNWDHFMMFTPFLFCLDNFYAISLVVAAAIILFTWECRYQIYPHRFWEKTNPSLQCAQCEERLCRKRFRPVQGLDKEKSL